MLEIEIMSRVRLDALRRLHAEAFGGDWPPAEYSRNLYAADPVRGGLHPRRPRGQSAPLEEVLFVVRRSAATVAVPVTAVIEAGYGADSMAELVRTARRSGGGADDYPDAAASTKYMLDFLFSYLSSMSAM